MDERAVGMLEVYGLVCAFLAADAGCKAANVTLEPFDKNKPANADSLPVPLLVTIKFRGSVEDVTAAEVLKEDYPWLEEIYRDMAEYMKKPEEVLNMFSEALKILDQNTVQFMIEQQQKEIEEQQKEMEVKDRELVRKDEALKEQSVENQRLREEIARLQKQLAEQTD